MKTPLLMALCAILTLFSCAKEIKQETVFNQSFTFQTVIEETEDSHEHYHVLLGEDNQTITLSNSVAEELMMIAKNGSKLDFATDNITSFLERENFNLEQVRISEDIVVQRRSAQKKVLAVMVTTPTHPCVASAEEVRNLLFNRDLKSKSLHAFYNLQSKGSVQFEGDIVEIEIDKSHISLPILILTCKNQLEAEGYNYDDYDYVTFLTDKTKNYLGVAFLNGKYSHVDQSNSNRAITHELGHNLGMHHSTKLTASGGIHEYGDVSCTMGGRFREINAMHRLSLGWMKSQNVYEVNRPTKELKLYPLGYELTQTEKDQVLILESPDGMYNLTVSMRNNYNVFDKHMSHQYINKLSIHQNYSYGKTLLVDILSEGESYYSEELRSTIRFKKFDSLEGSAMVDVY